MNLDGMVLLVRSEVDACEGADGGATASADTPNKHAPASASAATTKASAQEGDDLLANKLEDLLLSSSGMDKSEVSRRVLLDYDPTESRLTRAYLGIFGDKTFRPVHILNPFRLGSHFSHSEFVRGLQPPYFPPNF